MTKINVGKRTEKTKAPQNENVQVSGDRVLFLIDSGLKDIRALAEIFDSFSSSVDRRKESDTENTVKLSKAGLDVQKERYRHEEEMARITHEWKKFSDATADKERRLLFISNLIKEFQAEYDTYLALDTEEFLSENVTLRLDSLRTVIFELVKELK